MNEPELARMDPQARRFLTMVALGAAEGGAVAIQDRRGSFEKLMRFARPPDAPVRAVDLAIPGCPAAIPVRLYDPDPGRTEMPGLVYFHGGGLVAGSIETHDALCRSLAHEAGCRVVSVGYRLAPEHPFPTSLIDALVAARHVIRDAQRFGLTKDRIAIGGDSGGATLTTIVAQVMRRRRPFRAQLLLCPVLDFAGSHESRRRFASGFLLDAATMARDLAAYAPRRPLDDPRISPLQSRLLAGLPVTIIHTAGFDPLLDEGAAYAARLEDAGVEVAYTCHDSLIHHFYALTGMIPAARAALSVIARDIRTALA